MADKEKDGNYALNTLEDIWKYDKTRLLDLGNTLQVLISQSKPEKDEEARALSNFEKLTEDRSRPISHTAVDAIRFLPDVLAFAASPNVKAVQKLTAAKKASKIAPKLVGENTSDVAKAFSNSKLLSQGAKDMAARAWVRNLYENEEAMHRIAGKKLSPTEIEYVKKELPDAIAGRIKRYNEGVDELYDLHSKAVTPLSYKAFKEGKVEPIKLDSGKIIHLPVVDWSEDLNVYGRYLTKNGILTNTEWKKLAQNIAELPEYDRRTKFSHIDADKILKDIPKDKHKAVKDAFTTLGQVGKDELRVAGHKLMLKTPEAVMNEYLKTKFQTNNELEMKPDYWTLGSEPTPVSDFIASVFNVDFDDPARFNKKDIDTFFEFLEDIGTIEPGIKDKWTPRQKVSVMREMLSNKEYGSYIKDRWANSKHRENWIKSYSGE